MEQLLIFIQIVIKSILFPFDMSNWEQIFFIKMLLSI